MPSLVSRGVLATAVVEALGGHISRAAEALGVHRGTIHRWLTTQSHLPATAYALRRVRAAPDLGPAWLSSLLGAAESPPLSEGITPATPSQGDPAVRAHVRDRIIQVLDDLTIDQLHEARAAVTAVSLDLEVTWPGKKPRVPP
jgi:hypothetical protein